MNLPWRPVELVPGKPPIPTSLTQRETNVLRQLARDKRVLEIGSAYGFSAVTMALGGAKRVTAVDSHVGMNSYAAMTANLAVYGVKDRVDVVLGLSQDVLPILQRGHYDHRGEYDLAFIDGDHSVEGVASDLRWVRELVRAPWGGPWLMFHDYGEDSCPGVQQVLDAWRVPDVVIDTLAIYLKPWQK